MSRLLPLMLAGVLLGSACSAPGDDGPSPDDAAAAYAAALSGGDFSTVNVRTLTTPQVVKRYRAVIAGMGEVEPSVTVEEVTRDDDTAVADLAWTWPLAAGDWTYPSAATLSLVDGAWQVAWSPSVVEPSLGDDEGLDVSTLDPRRGNIVGAHGTVLVKPRDVFKFGIDRSAIKPSAAAASAKRLAQLTGIDAGPYVKQVTHAGPKAFVVAITYRAHEIPAAVSRSYKSIPGVTAYAGKLPLAPYRGFAAPILGTVGDVTAEMIKENPDRYSVGDQAGLSGLQARYDELLGGSSGAVVDAVRTDGSGNPRQITRIGAAEGKNLTITLDERLQTAAERILAPVGPASALVAIRPSTGAILAAANGPGTGGYNIATFGQYAPGSTFKTVSSLALLRAGVKPDTVVDCSPTVTVDGRQFENYDDYPSSALGRIPFRTAIANSCNTAVISQRGKVQGNDLADAAAALGLGVDHDLGFPAYFGQVPPAQSQTEAAADLIGQGKILASPMTMATVMASIQAGHTVVPWLVQGHQADPPSEAKLTSGEAAELRTLLRGVVTSGSGRGLLDVPGKPVIAKTGTAEFEKNGKTLTHAWMVAAQGDLAVAVFVDEGSSGSGTAGPLLEAFLRYAR